jgi:hypothetical protein
VLVAATGLLVVERLAWIGRHDRDPRNRGRVAR